MTTFEGYKLGCVSVVLSFYLIVNQDVGCIDGKETLCFADIMKHKICSHDRKKEQNISVLLDSSS